MTTIHFCWSRMTDKRVYFSSKVKHCFLFGWPLATFVSDQTRLGHWILDGDMAHSHLLRFALKESNFTDTTLLLCVAMTTPWNIMDQLQTWATLLHDHIDRLALTAEQTKQLQNESECFVIIFLVATDWNTSWNIFCLEREKTTVAFI